MQQPIHLLQREKNCWQHCVFAERLCFVIASYLTDEHLEATKSTKHQAQQVPTYMTCMYFENSSVKHLKYSQNISKLLVHIFIVTSSTKLMWLRSLSSELVVFVNFILSVPCSRADEP